MFPERRLRFVLGVAEEADDTAVGMTTNPNAQAMQTVFDRLLTYAPFRILASPGIYGWIALFALAVVLAHRRRQMLLFLLPSLLTLAWCLASPVNGSLGLALPVCFSAPVFLAAAAKCTRNAEENAL